MILQRLIYLDVEFTLIPNRAVVNAVARSMDFSDGEKQWTTSKFVNHFYRLHKGFLNRQPSIAFFNLGKDRLSTSVDKAHQTPIHWCQSSLNCGRWVIETVWIQLRNETGLQACPNPVWYVRSSSSPCWFQRLQTPTFHPDKILHKWNFLWFEAFEVKNQSNVRIYSWGTICR